MYIIQGLNSICWIVPYRHYSQRVTADNAVTICTWRKHNRAHHTELMVYISRWYRINDNHIHYILLTDILRNVRTLTVNECIQIFVPCTASAVTILGVGVSHNGKHTCTKSDDRKNFDHHRCLDKAFSVTSFQWRHNGHDGVSNHQSTDCLLNRLFRHRSKKTSKLRVTGLCAGNSPVTGEFPAQRTSDAENVSIWWRHHVVLWYGCVVNGEQA